MQAFQVIERIAPGRLRRSARELADAMLVGRRSRRRIPVSPQLVNRDYERGRWDYLRLLLAARFLSKGKIHSPAVVQTVGFGLENSKMLYPSIGG